LLKVKERSKPEVGQDEDGQKYLDESAQRSFLFLHAVLLYATPQGQFTGAGRPANRASIHVIWSLAESPITRPGSRLGYLSH